MMTGVIILFGTLAASLAESAAPSHAAASVEFFEKKIRPILAEHCHSCHSHQAEKLKAGLYLDSRAGLLRGSETGEVVVPGEPSQSRLIEAVQYANPDLQMPPKKKLSDAAIEDLILWVQAGAPWPDEPPPALAKPGQPNTGAEPTMAERRQHWAYQPVQPVSIPSVRNPNWCISEIDAFILAKLEEHGLLPAGPAGRRALIRRVFFDLTGLPPSPEEVAEFLRDESPDALARVVDRLLASPHYGERWARHWLDLVRYAETLGFEFDFDLYHAWRYRDYVIRAFNQDLPYNQFVLEHLAGDLLPSPRRDPVEFLNESILATGFFWMGEGRQTPVDIRQEQADVIEGQIDVLGKAFLGQTIACARCHDHKFDAITTQDYYALAGFLKSSRYQQAFLDPPETIEAEAQRLVSLKSGMRSAIASELAPAWREQAGQASQYMMAARIFLDASAAREASVPETAENLGLAPDRLERWIRAVKQAATSLPEHPLFAWVKLGLQPDLSEEEFVQQRHALQASLLQEQHTAAKAAAAAQLFDDFGRAEYEGWFRTGAAFAAGPSKPGDLLLQGGQAAPAFRLATQGAHSGLLSSRLQGELRSQTFTISKPFLHARVAGKSGRLNLIIDGYTLLMNPMYGGLTMAPTNDAPAWRTIAVDRWIGQRAYLEISDSTVPMHRLNPPPSTGRVPETAPDGYISVEEIWFSDDRMPPPPPPHAWNSQVLEHSGCQSPDALAEAYQELMIREIENWRSNASAGKNSFSLLSWLLENGLIDMPPSSFASLREEYLQIESALPSPLRAPAMADGTGEDEFIFIRGNYRTPADRAPRRLPEILARAESTEHARPSASPPAGGSGRLELARQLVDPSNPLLARVMVNRIWQHHFGEGLVRTPDDFGRLGQPPTHPELLDYLAAEFVRRGWSVKAMQRLIVLTRAYQMSSQPDPEHVRVDPENRLLHHRLVRRLEAEAIRDAILAVSGSLKPDVYGPSVLPYLTPYMEGRGRPNSGPLDGDGRRTIYLNARRNFLTPLLVAFDYPGNFSPIGRRDVSTVPSQALTLMNDPFVVDQARRWAARLVAGPDRTAAQRIMLMYETAFARPPSDEELREAQDFLARQSQRHGLALADPEPWADLCHVLLNVKEFIFLH